LCDELHVLFFFVAAPAGEVLKFGFDVLWRLSLSLLTVGASALSQSPDGFSNKSTDGTAVLHKSRPIR
jgi:hypothetical protein